jgi:ubiquinol-cytochrome c reductase cytochrome b subunit
MQFLISKKKQELLSKLTQKEKRKAKLIQKKEEEENSWNEWLAGLIDGDGSLLISRQGYCSCEITMDLRDEKALMEVKSKLGGSVKLRSGVKALRYRLHNLDGIKKLIHRINGQIRTKDRVNQLKAICLHLSLSYIEPQPLTLSNAWFAGYFDADGTIVGYFNTQKQTLTINSDSLLIKKAFQEDSRLKQTKNIGKLGIAISVTSKHKENLEPFLLLHGKVYYDKSGYGCYKWCIQSKIDILNFVTYTHQCPPRSSKLARLKLVKSYYELVEMNAHQASFEKEPAKYKAWKYLQDKWVERK